MIKPKFSWLSGGLVALGLVGLGGCGMGPGDYIVYKVSIDGGKQSQSCFAPDGPDANTYNDSNNALGNALWVLTIGPSGDYYLDVGGAPIGAGGQGFAGKKVLAGKESGDGFSFTAKDVDVNYDSGSNPATRVRTETSEILLSMDGSSVSGTITNKVVRQCTGTLEQCNNTPPSCTTKFTFVGSEVDDVQLEHEIR